jgi:hypothetical protein
MYNPVSVETGRIAVIGVHIRNYKGARFRTKRVDVLAQVLEQARKDFGENAKGLPGKPPKYGDLDIEQVLGAEYAFA